MTNDASGDEEETTTYRTPFGVEVDMRESHLAALPGKVYSEWLDSLNRALEVFGGNSVELERRLTQFVGTPTHVNDLPEGFDVEANRLLHNYLASLATLRDVQRMGTTSCGQIATSRTTRTTSGLSGKSRCGSRSATEFSPSPRSTTSRPTLRGSPVRLMPRRRWQGGGGDHRSRTAPASDCPDEQSPGSAPPKESAPYCKPSGELAQ